MRRGRVFIYLALIIVVIVGAAAIYFIKGRNTTRPSPSAQPTPQTRLIDIITAGQKIYPGAPITENMLSAIQIPEDKLVEGLFTNKSDLVGQYAKYTIDQGVPITSSMVTSTAGNVNLPGSYWAPFIPQGLTAVAIPISRLTSVGFGIRDGDRIDVIVTMLLVDVDAAFQSALPNSTAGVIAANSKALLVNSGTGDKSNTNLQGGDITNIASQSVSGGTGSPYGRVEFNDALQEPFYIVPSEAQRPRMVTQMIMQNIQVLHVGSFPLPGEAVTDQLIAPASGTATTPTPQPSGAQVTVSVQRPDIITLMVTPQDAVTLTYLVFSGVQITLTLRNPNDQNPVMQPETANLEYLLTQYNIPIPAKLPYGMQPRIDKLEQPTLPNDVTQASK